LRANIIQAKFKYIIIIIYITKINNWIINIIFQVDEEIKFVIFIFVTFLLSLLILKKNYFS